VDTPAAVLHFEDLRLEALALALFARDEDVGEKLHLDLDLSFPFAGFASAARHVEGKVARGESPRPRVLCGGKQLANRIERLQIGDRIRSRGAADWRLIDQHDVGDEFRSFKLSV